MYMTLKIERHYQSGSGIWDRQIELKGSNDYTKYLSVVNSKAQEMLVSF